MAKKKNRIEEENEEDYSDSEEY